MLLVATKENWPGEQRAALVPSTVAKLVNDGFEVSIEQSMGNHAGFDDAEYIKAGAKISAHREELLATADVVLSVRRPSVDEVTIRQENSVHISFLDPFRETALVEALAERCITSISLEMIPRSSKAQKLDALSSQASLSGYVAVIVAAFHLPRIFPMMMTPAGTLSPARVFVIGAGVAGLQAIATAHRLGARIEAFDTRPVVKEEVQSLSAKFLEIDLGETGQSSQGYANQLTPEQIKRQQDGMAAAIARSDIVITTAQVFGREAPRIVTSDMVANMRPTSVVIDMAVESGGNVENSVADEIVDINRVKVIGMSNMPSQVAGHASEMYSGNLYAFLNEFKKPDAAELELDRDDEILKGAVLTRHGKIVNERLLVT